MVAKYARRGADSNALCLPALLEAVLAYAGVLEGLLHRNREQKLG
jgi:hypothetical protein